MFEFIFLILGLIGLVLGAHLIIKGALNIAEHFKISQVFIGLTILAIGTNLPELMVIINGSIHRLTGIETSGLIVSEAIGTCIAQISLTLGIVGLLGTSLFLTKNELIRGGAALLGSVALVFILGLDGKLSRIDGIIFILFYIIYFLSLYREEKGKERKVKRAPPLRTGWAILSLLSGFTILIISSNFVIENAIILAEIWGISQSFIGAVIIGAGTSLPEIAVSISAVTKKATRLSIGNLVGSNIFDILLVLGLGSAISEFNVEKSLLLFDIPFLFITSIIVLIFFLTKNKLTKKEALFLIIIYSLYVGFKFLNL